MYRNRYVYLLLIVFSLGSLRIAAQEITFEKEGYEQALAKAKQENKPVFIDFYATWCGPCKMLEKEVFTDPEVKAYYDKNFVCVRVDVDKEQKLAQKYRIQSMPTLVFLNSKGKEIRRLMGADGKERFLHVGQEIMGERPVYPELYKQCQGEKKDLVLMQTLLLETPSYVSEVGGAEGMKWREKATKMFKEYLSLKGLDQMINNNDFQLFMLYQEPAKRNDPTLNFVNTHHEAFEKVIEPQMVWEYIISRQSGLINTLAKAGDLAYQEELNRITGDMKDVFSKISHTGLSVYDVMKSQADGYYALYAQKDEEKFLDLKDAYFQQMGEFLSFSDYQEAIGQLVEARKGVLKPKSYERCLTWLDKASRLNLQPREQLDLSCLMANCFRGLENNEKARACFNQAYVLAMQLEDYRMQAQIKAVLEQLSE